MRKKTVGVCSPNQKENGIGKPNPYNKILYIIRVISYCIGLGVKIQVISVISYQLSVISYQLTIPLAKPRGLKYWIWFLLVDWIWRGNLAIPRPLFHPLKRGDLRHDFLLKERILTIKFLNSDSVEHLFSLINNG